MTVTAVPTEYHEIYITMPSPLYTSLFVSFIPPSRGINIVINFSKDLRANVFRINGHKRESEMNERKKRRGQSTDLIPHT